MSFDKLEDSKIAKHYNEIASRYKPDDPTYDKTTGKFTQQVFYDAAATLLAMEFFNPSAVIDQSTSGGHGPALHTYDNILGKRTVNYCAWKTAASAKDAGEDCTVFEMNGDYAYDRDK